MSTSQDLPLPPLGLSEEEAQRRFDTLQEKLVGMWSSMRAMTTDERTIVVVPSQTTDFDVQGAQMQALEERIVGEGFASPSVQLRVTPTGEVEILSTHDQLLGGPSGQHYLGARFPADPAYARLISGEAEKVGRRLAREGVLVL